MVVPAADQGQRIQMILTAAPASDQTSNEIGVPAGSIVVPITGEAKNLSGPVAAGPVALDRLHGVLTALAQGDKSPGQSSATISPPIVMDATLTTKKDEGRGDFVKVGSDEIGQVFNLTPAETGRIPAEFLAVPDSHSPSTESVAIAPKPAVIPDIATPTITPRETLHLQLGPSDLGRLTLAVSVQSQQVQATVGVEHRGLGEFLAASQGVLDEAMRQHGLRLDALHIEPLRHSDVLGAGADRPGLLDHGHARQEASGHERGPSPFREPQTEAVIIPDHILEPGSRDRINLFA
jgi:hypothetical protein